MKAPKLSEVFLLGENANRIRRLSLPVAERSSWKDKLTGGLADKNKPSDFDPQELAIGVKHELEHTNDKSLAKEIAMDHLAEDPHYYSKLSESSENDDWENSLGELPGQKLARQRQDAEKKKASSSANRLSAIASRAKASDGGTKPLTRVKNPLGNDPGNFIKQQLTVKPMNRVELLKALDQARGWEPKMFDVRRAQGDVNRYYPGFKLDDFLSKVATKGSDEKWKLKTNEGGADTEGGPYGSIPGYSSAPSEPGEDDSEGE